MAQRRQTEGSEGTGSGQPQGMLGGPTTIILIIFVLAFFWWSRRRRAQLEERLQAQRRERDAAAALSARDVAHIMRAAPSPGAAAAAATEGLASAARMPAAPWSSGDDVVAGGAEPRAADADEARAREMERAEAVGAAERAAAAEARRAAQQAELAGESAARRLAAAEAAAEEARADTADAIRARAVAAPAEIGAADDDAAATLRRAMRDLEREVEPPFGAVRGDRTITCPDGYPIKANAQSRIYHEPGQVSYPQTVAEFCFASGEAAEAAGYRRSRARERRARE